jgi:hypothetical protein
MSVPSVAGAICDLGHIMTESTWNQEVIAWLLAVVMAG